eukprot:EG_transcript_51983
MAQRVWGAAVASGHGGPSPGHDRVPRPPASPSPAAHTAAFHTERTIAAQEDAAYRELAAVDAALEALRARTLNSSLSNPSDLSERNDRSRSTHPSPYASRYISPSSWYRSSPDRQRTR